MKKTIFFIFFILGYVFFIGSQAHATPPRCPSGDPTALSEFKLRTLVRSSSGKKMLFSLSDENRAHDWPRGIILRDHSITEERKMVSHSGRVNVRNDFSEIESIRGTFTLERVYGSDLVRCPKRVQLKTKLWNNGVAMEGGVITETLRLESQDSPNPDICVYPFTVDLQRFETAEPSSSSSDSEGETDIVLLGQLCGSQRGSDGSFAKWGERFWLTFSTQRVDEIETSVGEEEGAVEAVFTSGEPMIFNPEEPGSSWSGF